MKLVTLNNILLLSSMLILAQCNKYTKDGCTKDAHGNEHCLKKDEFDEEDDEPVFLDDEDTTERRNLFQWDPVKVGYERVIDIGNGQTLKMVTKALRPKLFLIEDFLTEEETDHIISKAKYHGLFSSGLHIDTKIGADKNFTSDKAKESLVFMARWDFDRDGKITMDEVIRSGILNTNLYLNSTDVMQMFEALGMHEMDDGFIDTQEFKKMDITKLGNYMSDLRETHPRFRDRFSEQIWLKHTDKSDHIMYNLREKVLKLTNLPRYIVEGGEPLQVLHYQPFGHYHAHFDGQNPEEYPNKECCHLDIKSQPYNCKLCRFITIVYYLNDVEEGGGTAFPVADKEDYDEKVFRTRRGGDLYNLSEFCHNASLVVQPKRGRAVMWYNHFLDDEGWLGDFDTYSLHGGCDVIKGEKWLANNWMTAPPAEFSHKESLYYRMESPMAH